MNDNIAQALTVSEAERIESRSFSAALLVLLCLFFALNYYFISNAGGDGGSGLGGTGKLGGESGLGGTGKSPFKLGYLEGQDESDAEQGASLAPEALRGIRIISPVQSDLGNPPLPPPVFLVENLRLTPEKPLRFDRDDESGWIARQVAKQVAKQVESQVDSQAAQDPQQSFAANIGQVQSAADALPALAMDDLNAEVARLTEETLLTNIEILKELMLAEASSGQLLALDESSAPADDGLTRRTRLSMPARPERPDPFTAPPRVIAPVPRVDVPSPPPVRPLRTLSTILQ